MAHYDNETVTPLFRPEAPSPFAALLERRIVFLRGPLEADKANEVAAQLLALDASSGEDVTLYIDSSGGEASGMFALYDTMQYMRSPVHTRCVGLAASAGAFLLATGTGRRSATPNARIVLQQPSGEAEGTAADIAVHAQQVAAQRRQVEEILARRTGQAVERIQADLDRDLWLTASEAVDYGLIDEIATRDRDA
ncbi:MAG: ATP-dependent Clp protease proteolytic subunit [Actinomycetota bacterium]|nr:ATP-dependent Clp protease proteolytic subunit [Actinomycetota bacterium]